MTLTVPTLSRRRSKSLEPGSWLLTAMLDIINIRRNACEQGSGWTNWPEDFNGRSLSWSLLQYKVRPQGLVTTFDEVIWISQKLWYPHRSRSEQATVGSNDRAPLWRLSPISHWWKKGGVIMVISFSFHPLCLLLPLQRRSFTISAQWMSSLRVLCDPRGKTLITPNCFNLISRQRANKKSKYVTKGNLYCGGAEPDKEIGALWCQPIKIQFKCK